MSGVRVGVDVGGTFTKAVAVDLASGEIVGRAVVPTTHGDVRGVAAGVVRTVADVVRAVGAERVDLVTHSTTQAVNALLEGDVGTVGVLGLGRRPELKQARKRTQLERVELSPGRFLRTLPEFLDVSDGLDEVAVHDALARFRDAGATAVSVAEAFAPDDSTFERRVTAMASEAGLPACASSELTGLYGLELRAVTAALNASILPIAERTAEVVAVGVDAAGVTAPVMVMRGDGGATDLDGFRRAPARTLYSGPAASVAGALRFAGVAEGVVVEVPPTSKYSPSETRRCMSAPATLAAGPDSIVMTGRRRISLMSMTPPSPRMIISGAEMPASRTLASVIVAVAIMRGRIEALMTAVRVRVVSP